MIPVRALTRAAGLGLPGGVPTPGRRTQARIAVASRRIPGLVIPGGNRTVQQSWQLSLQGAASFPGSLAPDPANGGCYAFAAAAAAAPAPLVFQWSVDPVAGGGLDMDALPPAFAATRASPQLELPANFLQVLQALRSPHTLPCTSNYTPHAAPRCPGQGSLLQPGVFASRRPGLESLASACLPLWLQSRLGSAWHAAWQHAPPRLRLHLNAGK